MFVILAVHTYATSEPSDAYWSMYVCDSKGSCKFSWHRLCTYELLRLQRMAMLSCYTNMSVARSAITQYDSNSQALIAGSESQP